MISSEALAAEKKLVEQAKTNKAAFLELYDAHFKRIYQYAYYRTLNPTEAEEITSQTFLAALENIERYEHRGVPFAVWLYKIASSKLTNLNRKKEQTVVLEEAENIGDKASTPEEALLRKNEKEELIHNLKKLPASQQQAIVLRFLQDCTYREISEIMDKTEGSVKQLLHRGLKSLRERMMHHD